MYPVFTRILCRCLSLRAVIQVAWGRVKKYVSSLDFIKLLLYEEFITLREMENDGVFLCSGQIF